MNIKTLHHYEARGFCFYDTRTHVEQLPPDAIGPWVGAYGAIQ